MTQRRVLSVRRAGKVSFTLAMAAVLVGRFVASAPVAAAADSGTYVVNSTGDENDLANDGMCLTSTGTCTLRAALTEANRDGRASTVTFGIAGTGPHTIRIASSLPMLSDTAGGTRIDGYTQSGSTPNTDALVSNAVLKIQIRGTGVAGPEGLVVGSAGNTVRGIAFFDVRQSIRIVGSGATDNIVAGSFLGTDATGTFGFTDYNANAGGVVIRTAASRNIIGGPLPADRNVISGNGARGVTIGLVSEISPTNENRIENNIIGLSPNGGARLSNLGHGIDINAGASLNVVGGSGKGNLVSGNSGHGIEISHGTTTGGNQVVANLVGTGPGGGSGPAYARNTNVNLRVEDRAANTLLADNVIGNNTTGGIKVDAAATGTRIQGNRIGVSTTGASIPNVSYGVQIELGASDSVVGPGNMIAWNGTGVRLMGTDTDRNTITRNSIHDNAGLGIDIEPLGSVNPNDADDADDGANDQLNFPVLNVATDTSVSGSACPSCRVELFEADTTETSAYGEGKTFLGSAQADSSGNFTVTVASADRDRIVTSTATDGSGNTSEFSANKLLHRSPDVVTDGFSRSVTDGWGDAELGGPYTTGVGNGTPSVNGTAGAISLPAGGTQSLSLLDVSERDVELVVTLRTDRLPVGGDHAIAVVARREDELTSYAGRTRIAPDGSTFVAVLRGETVLAEARMPHTSTPGGSWLLRTRVTGANPTTVRAKAWPVGTTEPSGWAVEINDSTSTLQQSGAVGVLVRSSETSTVTVQFDDLIVRRVAPK